MHSVNRWCWIAAFVLGWAWTGASVSQAAAPKAEPPNLVQFIAPEFCAAVVIHPQRILASPLLKALPEPADAMLKEVPADDPVAAAALEHLQPSKLHRVVVVIDPQPAGSQAVSVGLIVQFREPIDGVQILADLMKDGEPVEFEGITYTKSASMGQDMGPVGGYAAGGKILLLAAEPTLQRMLKPSDGPRPLLDQLRQCNLKNDILVEFAAEPLLASPLGESIKAMQALAPAMPDGSKVDITELKSVSLALNLGTDPLVSLAIAAKGAALADSVEQGLGIPPVALKPMVDALKDNPPPAIPGELVPKLQAFGSQLLDGWKVARTGDRVTLTIPCPEALGELVETISSREVFAKVVESAKSLPFGPGASPAEADVFSTEEPKAEEKPADAMEEPKADAEEPKVEEKPADAMEEPKADAEEPKAEEKPADAMDEPKADAEEPKAEEKPADAMEEPKADEEKAADKEEKADEEEPAAEKKAPAKASDPSDPFSEKADEEKAEEKPADAMEEPKADEEKAADKEEKAEEEDPAAEKKTPAKASDPSDPFSEKADEEKAEEKPADAMEEPKADEEKAADEEEKAADEEPAPKKKAPAKESDPSDPFS